MNDRLDAFCRISAAGSSVRTEVIAGLSTFAAMAYIICVQPALLSGVMRGHPTGMPFGALLTTTCIMSAFGSILMGVVANYPIGLAPGMGSNFFFVFNVLGGCAAATGMAIGTPEVWHAALGVVLLSGVLFLAVSFTNLRKSLLNSISPSMKNAIAAGLGLFIATLGLKNGHIIRIEEGQLMLGTALTDPAVIIFGAGLVVIAVLLIRRIPGGILIGMGAGALIALAWGKIEFTGICGLPANPMPVVAKADVAAVFRHAAELIPLVVICMFMDIFDTMGTVIGVGTNAGLIRNGELPRAERVFAADSVATIVGAVGGHSTVTSYVESTVGVEAGGRTGLTAVVVGICFLLALIFFPVISSVAGYAPITSSALVAVGAMMMRNVTDIDWQDYSEAIPAFLIIAGIPLSSSIIGGIAVGLCIYPVIKLLAGKGRELGWFSYLTAVLLLLYLGMAGR